MGSVQITQTGNYGVKGMACYLRVIGDFAPLAFLAETTWERNRP